MLTEVGGHDNLALFVHGAGALMSLVQNHVWYVCSRVLVEPFLAQHAESDLVSLGRHSERALLGTSEIQGDEGERERGSADTEQDSVGSARMLAEPIRLQKSCESVLIR